MVSRFFYLTDKFTHFFGFSRKPEMYGNLKFGIHHHDDVCSMESSIPCLFVSIPFAMVATLIQTYMF